MLKGAMTVPRVAKPSWHEECVEVEVVLWLCSMLGIRLEDVQAHTHIIERRATRDVAKTNSLNCCIEIQRNKEETIKGTQCFFNLQPNTCCMFMSKNSLGIFLHIINHHVYFVPLP